MTEVTKAAWASAKKNPEFFWIETCSGFRMTTTDPKGKQHLLPDGASDHDLGVALLDALEHSRFLPPRENPEEDRELFDADLGHQLYMSWVKKLKTTYGYKTETSLFKGMALCNVECRDGSITILPNHYDKPETWTGKGISPDKNVVVSADSSPAQVGAALRLAFSHCT
jgi:CDI immunity protein